MDNFLRCLLTEWRKLGLPFESSTVVAAVSGGADSLSLLLALAELHERGKLKLRLVAAHFNHGLRAGESDADADFVKRMAAERNIELALGRGPVAREGSLEQNARTARYAFLSATAANLKATHVLTAHTLNDQAETFLLNLIRGSGVEGLSAMRPVREMKETATAGAGPIVLARPFLRWASRQDTENFCRRSGVEFRYDTMNEDMSFKRVRVRKMLLPMLKEFNPKIVETLAQTAELMQSVRPGGGAPDSGDCPEFLPLAELREMDLPELHEKLRGWLRSRRGTLRAIGLKHIEAIGQLALSTKSGRTVELPGFGLVRKKGGSLRFENIRVDK